MPVHLVAVDQQRATRVEVQHLGMHDLTEATITVVAEVEGRAGAQRLADGCLDLRKADART